MHTCEECGREAKSLIPFMSTIKAGHPIFYVCRQCFKKLDYSNYFTKKFHDDNKDVIR